MVQNYDGIAISQLGNTQLEKKLQRMLVKGYLSAWLSLATLVPIITQHKLNQTKEHVLWQYITTCQKQQL